MIKIVQKSVSVILLTILIMTCFAGCGNDEKVEIENGVTAYLMAVSGFNLRGMQSCLAEGSNKDFGVDTSVIESGYVQTDTYKKQVESMFKALGATMEFTVDSTEKTDDSTAIAMVTLKCADANEAAVEEYTHRKVDEYIQAHPETVLKTDLDRNDISITVMAQAFNEFVQLQPKVETKVSIVLTKKNGAWKIAAVSENGELKAFLTSVFGTF